jgi:hypothetical protein
VFETSFCVGPVFATATVLAGRGQRSSAGERRGWRWNGHSLVGPGPALWGPVFCSFAKDLSREVKWTSAVARRWSRG